MKKRRKEGENMYEFRKPFTVRDGKIYDRDGKYVRLWGVNYYTPFNHNYINLEELGVDHFKAIDERNNLINSI